MNSLRARLTLSYALVVTVVLAGVSLLICRITFEVSAHAAFERLELGVARARAAAEAPPNRNPGADVARVVAAAAAPGIVVFAPGPRGPYPGPPGPRRGRETGPPPASREPEPPHAPRAPFMLLATVSMLGLSEHTLDVRGTSVVIAPAVETLEPTLAHIAELFVGLLLLSVGLGWTIASWMARQAIAPLIALTRELERFAGGDFTPRTVITSEGSELGALVAAFNGAAAQVDDAFRERREVEQSMRRFIADAGHELRTPLTVITGYLEILGKGGVDDPATRERAFATLSGESRRMRILIDRLLALARLERPDVSEMREVDVAAVAADAIAHVQAARGGTIDLACPGRVRVFADPAELREAIENVVDNAVKYGRAQPVDVRIETLGTEASICVGDRGEGIPEHERTRLFERFFRGDNRGDIEGTGLGLAIAQRAITRCSGRIVIAESRPGRTIFALTLPLAPERSQATQPLRI